jgi:phospholipase/lecithinase/hemolysin
MRVHSRLAAATLAAVLMSSAGIEAQPKNRPVQVDLFVTFGDSLADTGNLYAMTSTLNMVPAIPPSDSPYQTYFEGRFSNGRVGFEHLWDRLRGYSAPLSPVLSLGYVPNKGAVDFAFGGSTSGQLSQTPDGMSIPGLLGQVDLFLTLRKSRVPARTVAAIVTGSNDYLTTTAPPANPVDVVANIVTAIERLHARGVNTVMVVNVADLGAVPLVAAADAAQRAGLSALSAAHNQLLSGALAALAAQRPSLHVIPIDVAAVIATLPPAMDTTVPAIAALAGPQAAACLFVDATTCVDVPTFDVGQNFFYWDVLHPTATVHEALGSYMCSQLPGCQ